MTYFASAASNITYTIAKNVAICHHIHHRQECRNILTIAPGNESDSTCFTSAASNITYTTVSELGRFGVTQHQEQSRRACGGRLRVDEVALVPVLAVGVVCAHHRLEDGAARSSTSCFSGAICALSALSCTQARIYPTAGLPLEPG